MGACHSAHASVGIASEFQADVYAGDTPMSVRWGSHATESNTSFASRRIGGHQRPSLEAATARGAAAAKGVAPVASSKLHGGVSPLDSDRSYWARPSGTRPGNPSRDSRPLGWASATAAAPVTPALTLSAAAEPRALLSSKVSFVEWNAATPARGRDRASGHGGRQTGWAAWAAPRVQAAAPDGREPIHGPQPHPTAHRGAQAEELGHLPGIGARAAQGGALVGPTRAAAVSSGVDCAWEQEAKGLTTPDDPHSGRRRKQLPPLQPGQIPASGLAATPGRSLQRQEAVSMLSLAGYLACPAETTQQPELPDLQLAGLAPSPAVGVVACPTSEQGQESAPVVSFDAPESAAGVSSIGSGESGPALAAVTGSASPAAPASARSEELNTRRVAYNSLRVVLSNSVDLSLGWTPRVSSREEQAERAALLDGFASPASRFLWGPGPQCTSLEILPLDPPFELRGLGPGTEPSERS